MYLCYKKLFGFLRISTFTINNICLFPVFFFPADPEGPGVCATILTLVSFILVLVTMPLSLCVTVKVRMKMRKRSTFKDRRRPNERAKKGLNEKWDRR